MFGQIVLFHSQVCAEGNEVVEFFASVFYMDCQNEAARDDPVFLCRSTKIDFESASTAELITTSSIMMHCEHFFVYLNKRRTS